MKLLFLFNSEITVFHRYLYNKRRYFTIYIIFNDKIAPDQWRYIIPYLLYDVTGRINPRWIMPFVSSTLKSFEKWRSPLFGATGNFNHQSLPYGILFLTFISTMSFIYCHLNFHANLLRPWPFPLICLITTGTVVIFLPENSRQFPFNR